MGFLAAIPAWVGYAVSAGATVLSAKQQADAQEAAASANARSAREAALANQSQLEKSAIQDEAVGQREALANRRKAELMLSRAQAVAGASGAGGLDENLMMGILQEGETAAGYSIYRASESAAGKRYAGEAGLWQAENQGNLNIAAAKNAGRASIMGAAAKGFGSAFSAFSPGAAPTSTTFSMGTLDTPYR